jgi:phosphatidate cytidylyltransferase
MNENFRHRFFAVEEAFRDPITLGAAGIIVAVLVVTRLVILVMRRAGRIPDKPYHDVMVRWRSWLFLSVILFAPVLLGTAWVMAAVCLLSLLCYQEFARATGLFREKVISLAVLFGIGLMTFAVVDNYSRLFFASAALTVGLIAIITIPQDRPRGYIQRTALGVLGFLLFGYCFGYIGYFANSHLYRSILILLMLGVELNDVFAFCCGKLIGGPKAIPNTSPGKTWAGCLGALVLTTAFVMTLAHFVFQNTDVDRFVPLLIFGAGLSILGQFGDLLLSSIKRDVGIKDIGSVIPGHGGLLDRFDSLVLVPPAAFHYLSLYLGPIGMDEAQRDQAQRILTGG